MIRRLVQIGGTLLAAGALGWAAWRWLPSPLADVGCLSMLPPDAPVRVVYLIGNANIWLPYMLIPATLLAILAKLKKRGDVIPDRIVLLFAAFIVGCGLTHAATLATVYYRVYWLANYILIPTALVSWYTWLQLSGPVEREIMSLPSGATHDAALQRAADAASTSAAALSREQTKTAELEAKTFELTAANEELRRRESVIHGQQDAMRHR